MRTTKKVLSKCEVLKMLKDKEECLIRMRNGLVADLEMALELKAKNNPELQTRIFEIERGILNDIKELVNQYEKETDNPTKNKIITSLRKKNR